jgi:NitT/TauT family transport system permease protein
MSSTIHPAQALGRRLPNAWDLAALLCVFGLIMTFARAVPGTIQPLDSPEALAISLDPANLPEYAVRTTLRMFAALAASLLFTFTYAAWAAKGRRAGLVLIPILDVLQSVPILGFLSFTTVFFMSLFPGKVMGLELAAIFAIFTSQAWNMAFSFYQSLITTPTDLVEAAQSFRLTWWQRFWRLDVPFAMPGLVWNTMMSMSGGWFFVVASEAITLGDKTWTLPGIGSYVAMALDKRDMGAVLWAILAMGIVILLYDQLMFRPLVAWSAKFRFEMTQGATGEDPWLLKLLRRTRVLRIAGGAIADVFSAVGTWRIGRPMQKTVQLAKARSRLGDAVFFAAVALVVIFAVWKVVEYVVGGNVGWGDLGEAALLGLATLTRVVVMIALATAVWVPIGVWIGLRPNWARRIQAGAQFLAAFPANLLFPIFVVVIVRFHLNSDIWLTPLMILGTQWYILFNVVAGASAFPGDLQEAAKNFRVGGWLWWRRVILPGIFPYYVTGAITASGGSWNASIVSEVAAWGDDKLSSHGLGAYIAHATDAGDFPRIVLGVVVMSAYVLLFNRAWWRPLYAYSTRRITLT